MVEQSAKRRAKQNIVRDYIHYIAMRLFIIVLHQFDVEKSLKFACLIGRMLWKYYHRGRQRSIEHLQASFPEKDKEWIEKTGKRSFEHIVMMAVDVLYTPRLVRKDNWKQYSYYVNAEHAKWLMKEGKGMLMVAAHYGNFEIVGYLLGMFGFNIYSVARPLDNKFINKYLYDLRQRAGQRIIDKKGAAQIMQSISSTGDTLCFIADQDAGQKGTFVPFFGKKASTYKSIALLAMTNNIPIGIGYSRRIENRFFFEIGVNRIIFPHEWADKDDPIYWVTAEYTKAIEDFIREDPSQYWWLHRRWKHRPKGELREQ